jgi:hypothetical protein
MSASLIMARYVVHVRTPMPPAEAFDDTSNTMTAFAQNALMTSEDTISVEADGNGSIVTYDAVLKLKGLLGLSDPLLGLSFKQIGDRAAVGLIETLAGERVAE